MTTADLDAVNAIYNHYVAHSTCTYQLEPDDAPARRAWFEAHGERHPLIVADDAGTVVGWGSLSPYNARGGYARTVEDSIYVDVARHRQGIGRLLLGTLVARAGALGHHAIIAGIDAAQTGSVALHGAFGFVEVGRMREVGFKHGRWLDVLYMQRALP